MGKHFIFPIFVALLLAVGLMPSPGLAEDILLEAEAADSISAPMKTYSDPLASGGKYIRTDEGSGDQNSNPPAAGVARYTFTAKGGVYKILMRISIANGSNSVWVRIVGATSYAPGTHGSGWIRWNDMSDGAAWHWDEVHSSDHSSKVVNVTLPAGQNTLEIARREDGAKMDGILITDNLTLDQATVPPTLSAKAQYPVPASGTADVTSPLFQWTAGIGGVLHDVYFGKNPTPGPAEYRGPMPGAMYFHVEPLEPGATYYWRIDEIDGAGVKQEGDVWSFTVTPLTAHFPQPYDGALWRKTNVQISWAAGQGAVTHKLYGATIREAVATANPAALLATTTDTTFDATGLLEPATTYYWRVDEVDGVGAEQPGAVWTFSTFDPAGGAVAEIWNNVSLSGKPTVVKTVPEINFDWGSGTTPGTNSPDPAIPVDNFSIRFWAELNVPVTGTYRIYEASDDGSRTYLNGQQIAAGWYARGTTEDASAELDLIAGERYLLTMEYYDSGGGATAFLRWSGPGIPKEIIPQGALQPPTAAYAPVPGNNAVEVSGTLVLTWAAGTGAAAHSVYLGADKDKVAANDPSVFQGVVTEPSFAPAALQWNTTYYWKVDETGADGKVIAGSVWTFKTADFLVVNLSQQTLVYDNSVAPYASELALDTPADWTANGVTDLALRFQGRAAPIGSVTFDEGTGTYAVTGAGADIWGSSDQFTYAYKTLKGNGEIVAQVTSNGTGNSTWGKGGVMIRETLAANSRHMIMAMTSGDGGGIAMQGRPTAGGNSSSLNGDITATPPQWVKLTREGNNITAYYSADGADWKLFTDASPDNAGGPISNPIELAMGETVYVGLAVTSHDGTNLRTYQFANVSTKGDVPAGPFTTWHGVGMNRNWTAPLYAALQDAAGATAVVAHPDPAAVNMTNWGLWRIPTSAFAGVDLKNVTKLYLGVGSGQPGGIGSMNFADIRVLKPVTAPAADAIDVTIPGDAVIGQPNDNDWPAAEAPAGLIDDKSSTKFLHFKGETEPSGFIVTPVIGKTVVTGLTFTTANDAAERDPAAFELYGSNQGVDGPWALIAKGAIDDFARPIAWPRLTKSVTPIGFTNTVPFAHYKVMVTALRTPASANSMQVAEVELLGILAE